jgi:hypothetical protein
MWSVYGNQGVAVKTTVGKLNALFEKTGLDFIYGQMSGATSAAFCLPGRMRQRR